MHIFTTETIYELDMCLWNTDAPGGNKVKIRQKSLSPTYWPYPTPGAWDGSEVWGTFRWTYNPSLVTVSSPKLKLLDFVYKRDGITDRQTDRRTDGQTDDPITRCPRRTFQAGALKRVSLETYCFKILLVFKFKMKLFLCFIMKVILL